jgi:hypothetical protein
VKQTTMSRAVRMLAVGALLIAWQQFAGVAPCPVAIGLLVLLALAIGNAALESAVQRRHAFTAQYLAPEGRLFRLLRPGVLMLVRQGGTAVLLAAVLTLNALALEAWQHVLLLGDALLMTALVGGFARLLAGEARAAYVAPLARRWAVRVNALCVWGVLLLGLLYTPQASLAPMRWEEVISLAAGQVSVACEDIALLARPAAVGGSLMLWGAQNLFADLGDTLHTLFAWLLFLAAFGVSFLFAWAYSLALAGVIAAPWQAWRDREAPAA